MCATCDRVHPLIINACVGASKPTPCSGAISSVAMLCGGMQPYSGSISQIVSFSMPPRLASVRYLKRKLVTDNLSNKSISNPTRQSRDNRQRLPHQNRQVTPLSAPTGKYANECPRVKLTPSVLCATRFQHDGKMFSSKVLVPEVLSTRWMFQWEGATA